MTASTAHPGPPALERAPCLATGDAGVALWHIHHARAGTGPWRTAHHWAATMTTHPVSAHPQANSLYSGAPAVAFTLHSADQPAYVKAINTLDHHIAAATRHRLDRAHERIDHGHLPALREFDLISGLTGLGAYLLHRHGGGDLLRDVLAYLVRLSAPLATDGEVRPGWWTGNGPTDQPAPQWAGGHANLGMAHGITGPLALLSTAMRRRITVTGHADAIAAICAWLDRWRCGTPSQPWWPETISLRDLRTGVVHQPAPHRPSWCYGTPGIARAQQLAALALGDQSRRRAAEDTLVGCLTDKHQLAHLRDATVCHGWAGLIQTTWRAAADADTDLVTHVPRLLARMEQHIVRHGLPPEAGLLNGAAGIELVRHTTAVTQPPASRWDACLLLSG